jgi:fibronectin type 3 domain-containing protein
VLSWLPDGEGAPVRLVRRLLTPPTPKSQQQGPLAPVPEVLNQSMLVESGLEQGHALDPSAHFNERYEYRAQRVARVDVNGKTLELAGELSSPIAVDVKDVFPPAVPTGLAAVASSGEDGKGPSIDLSWQPNAEADLAGYIVYRREEGGAWRRISPATPEIEPGFHDAQVLAGHTYQYAVSAVDKGGQESERSELAEETVPQSQGRP